MSSCSWSAAPLPIRTGLDPGSPRSGRDLLGEIGGAVDAVHDLQRRVPLPACSVDPLAQPFANAAASSRVSQAQQRVDGERGVPDPGVAVVPVALAADLLRQAGRRRGDRARRSARRSSASASWPNGSPSPATARCRCSGASQSRQYRGGVLDSRPVRRRQPPGGPPLGSARRRAVSPSLRVPVAGAGRWPGRGLQVVLVPATAAPGRCVQRQALRRRRITAPFSVPSSCAWPGRSRTAAAVPARTASGRVPAAHPDDAVPVGGVPVTPA